MILFAEQWSHYPNAIIHTKTRNKSWLRLAAVYKAMGIKNHAFHLALHNPALEEVDPFDPNLTIETMADIAYECKTNPWYYLRECAMVPGQSGSPAVMLSANRGNIAAYWCFFSHVTTFLIQPRQTGKSVSIDELMVMLLDIRCTNTQINLLTKDTGLRTKNIERLKKVFAEIPQYLNQRSKKDMDNTEQISIKALENTYVTHVPQGNERDAEKVGRGLTSPIFHIDEPAFQKFIKISLGAALAAGGAARGIAQAAGEPYGTILTTTAGKKDDRDGKYVYGLLSDAAEWTEKFFDCDSQEDLEKVIRGASRKGVVRINITFNHRQLGYTDEWMREQLEASMLEGEAADRDHFNRWTSGSQSSPLSAKQTQIIRDSQESDKYVEIHKQNSYVTRWYIEEDQISARMSQGHYILASDTSEAGGGDDISVVVLDIRTGEVIVTGTYNDTNLLTFAEWLFGLFVRFQNLTGIIERKSTGGMIIDVLIRLFLARGIDPFRRLFNFAVQDAEEFPERFQEISLPMGRRPNDITTRHKKTFGFGTSSGGVTSRTELYSTTLRLAAEKGGSKVKDKTTIDQITSLEIRNGRVDHPSGEHDDMCFVGDTLVRTVTGNRPIKDLKLGDLVLTRKGYKPVVKLFCSEKEVITKYGLTGTPNHPFITPSGEIQFKDLKDKTKVFVWNEKLSFIMEKTITDILSPIEHNTETTSTATINGKKHLLHFIDRSMKTTLDRYHQATSFITRTITTSIITPIISSVLPHSLSTSSDIQCLKKKESDEVKPVSSRTTWTHGENKIQNLLVNKRLRMVRNLKGFLTGVNRTRSLQGRYMPKQVEKAPKQEGRKEIVYNIMVADCHEYFVNDILVHNCIGWLLCWWLISNGKNLHFYGINSKDILSLAAPPQEMTQQDYRKHQEQQEVRRKIEELYAKIANEQDEYIASRLENELRMVNRKLVLEEGEIFSVDELINSLRENKRRNKSNRLLTQSRGLYDEYNKQRVATTNKQVEYVNGVRTVTRY